MRPMTKIFALALAAILGVAGCNQRTDEVDSGGVILSISSFNGLPVVVSASGAAANGGLVQIASLVTTSVIKNPGRDVSQLMNVELESYEVTYTRADTGTRVPPPLIEYIFGVVPVGQTNTLNNPPIMRIDQWNNPPLRDLLVFGRDLETNSTVIRLTVGIRMFGHTLSGKKVESAPAYFTLDIVP